MSEHDTKFSRAKASYNYCGICGHTPKSSDDEPNRAPIRWWDADDGWKIATLCRGCWEEFGHVQPKPSDYAYEQTNHVCDVEDTDEDILEAL